MVNVALHASNYGMPKKIPDALENLPEQTKMNRARASKKTKISSMRRRRTCRNKRKKANVDAKSIWKVDNSYEFGKAFCIKGNEVSFELAPSKIFVFRYGHRNVA